MKFYNKDFVITEDCITAENLKTLDAYKLLIYYSLYNNLKLPDNYFKRLETTTKVDDLFISSYYTLNTIFFLKNLHPNLTQTQKLNLNPLEQKLSNSLFTN
ncbi:MAG: hypothetical protein IPF58_13255 [Saprospirales bacterium]|nr:hypothetical protein [Saprospirales bacterium]